MIELRRYFSFFFFEIAKNCGRSDDAKRRKKGDGLIMSGLFSDNFVLESV